MVRRRRCARPSRGSGRRRPRARSPRAVSRTTASCRVSPHSTWPPGTDHWPCAAPLPRRIEQQRAPGGCTPRPTATSGRSDSLSDALDVRFGVEVLVHGERTRGEAVGLEEVLGRAVTRERRGVDAEAAGGAAVLDERVGHHLTHPDLARLGLHEQVGDHTEARAGAQLLDHDRAERRAPRRRWCRRASSASSRASSAP